MILFPATIKLLKTDEIRQLKNEITVNDETIIDTVVSSDGAWQKRGHDSLNGVVTVIQNDVGKCIDYRVLSKKCNACSKWESKKGTVEYEKFISDHECPIKHVGSAGSMEAKGVVDCFQSSVDNRKLRYTKLIGDGDSKTHASILTADPYPGIKVEKLECIGHIQKRVGSRLRKLRSTHKGPLSDGKGITGQGRLTEKLMNKLQNLYGIALRQNVDKTVHQLKVAVRAVLHHSTEFENSENCHLFCPRGPDSWCKYWKDPENYQEKKGMPMVIHQLIKPVFTDLSNETLLSKCLHSKTQNANESINNITCTKCPKNIYVQRNVLEMGVASAVINFNDGNCGILNVFINAGMETGYFTKSFCIKKDETRIQRMNKKTNEQTKKQRKRLRAIRKNYVDKNKEKEGVCYESGAF